MSEVLYEAIRSTVERPSTDSDLLDIGSVVGDHHKRLALFLQTRCKIRPSVEVVGETVGSIKGTGGVVMRLNVGYGKTRMLFEKRT